MRIWECAITIASSCLPPTPPSPHLAQIPWVPMLPARPRPISPGGWTLFPLPNGWFPASRPLFCFSKERQSPGQQGRSLLKWRAPESGRGIRRACGGSGEEPPLVGEPSSRVAAFRWRRTLIYSTKAACRAIPRFRHWHLGGYRRGHIVPFLASFYLPPAHTCCSILGTQAETSASRSVRR